MYRGQYFLIQRNLKKLLHICTNFVQNCASFAQFCAELCKFCAEENLLLYKGSLSKDSKCAQFLRSFCTKVAHFCAEFAHFCTKLNKKSLKISIGRTTLKTASREIFLYKEIPKKSCKSEKTQNFPKIEKFALYKGLLRMAKGYYRFLEFFSELFKCVIF